MEQILSYIDESQVVPFEVVALGRVWNPGAFGRTVCRPELAVTEVVGADGHCVSGVDESDACVGHNVIKHRQVCLPSLVLWCRLVSLDRSISAPVASCITTFARALGEPLPCEPRVVLQPHLYPFSV